MKRMMTILAALVALCGPVRAADQANDWFNAGIGANWPTNTAMFGGTWHAGAEALGHMTVDNSALLISTEEDAPLLFDATYRKTLGTKALGDTTAAKEVAVSFSCAFQPFSKGSLPEVPEDAKGAVILVTEMEDPEEAEDGTLYYAAWDGDQRKNIWKPSAATGVGTGEIFRVTVTIAPGAATDFLTIGYALSNRETISGVALYQTSTVSSGMYFTGVGKATGIDAINEPGGCHDLSLVPISGLSVTNVTADGVSVGSGYGIYFVGDGADVVVYYDAASLGYGMEGDGIVVIGRMTEDTTVDKDTKGVPNAEALGTYLVDSEGIYTIYAEGSNFVEMAAALKDGDTVEMLRDAELPSGAWLTNSITFLAGKYGEYVLSSPSGDPLTNAADISFMAKAATNLPPFFIYADRTLTLPSWTKLEDYSLAGQEYACVRIGDGEWVFYDGKWQSAGLVTMNFYYPGYFDKVALTLKGWLGQSIERDLLAGFLGNVCYTNFVQDYYWDSETELLIDGVYWYDGTWSDADGVTNAFPTRYVAGDFYPGSTAIPYRITYDMGVVPSAKNPETNPTEYKMVDEDGKVPGPVLLAAAVPLEAPPYFQRWKDRDGNTVTSIDPIEIGFEIGSLTNLELTAEWGPNPVPASVRLRTSAMVSPGKSAASYDTAERAQAAATTFNADEEGAFLAPEGFEGDGAAYSANFKATANGSTVAVNLTEDAKEKIAGKVDGATLSAAADLTDPSVSTLTIDNVEPGFYYTVVGGTNLEDVVTEGRSALANGTSVELIKPDLGNASKAFYKIKAAVK